jgi:putative phosphoesterase
MKLLVVSDIHGSPLGAKRLRRIYEQEQPDQILLLGDILDHGEGSEVISFFRLHAYRTSAVKGNCDSVYDEKALMIPLPEHRAYDYLGHTLHLQHILSWAVSYPPGDMVLFGHTHVKTLYREKGVTYLNPGSLSYPRDEAASYALITPEGVYLKDADSDKTIIFLES